MVAQGVRQFAERSPPVARTGEPAKGGEGLARIGRSNGMGAADPQDTLVDVIAEGVGLGEELALFGVGIDEIAEIRIIVVDERLQIFSLGLE